MPIPLRPIDLPPTPPAPPPPVVSNEKGGREDPDRL